MRGLVDRIELRWLFLGLASYFAANIAMLANFKLFHARTGTAIFGSFWESGRAAWTGADPYLVWPLTWRPPLDANVAEVNMNPPSLLPLFQGFALLPSRAGAVTWVLLSAVLFLGCVALLLRSRAEPIQRRQLLWLFVTPWAFGSIALGQIYVLLFAASVGAWLAFGRDRDIAAGLLVGLLVAMKPNFLVWPVLLFLAGHRRPALAALAMAGVLSVLPVLLYGTEVYAQWLTAVGKDNHTLLFPHEVSVIGNFTRLGLHPVGLGLAALLCLTSAFVAWRFRPSALDISGLAVAVAILASPLSWADYLLVLVPALLWRPWGIGTTAVAFVLVVPATAFGVISDLPVWQGALASAVFFVPTVALSGLMLARCLGGRLALARSLSAPFTRGPRDRQIAPALSAGQPS